MNGIYRVEKRKMTDVKGIQIHHNREKDGLSHSNQDIDWSRTDRNVHLDECRNFRNAIKKEIEKLNLKRAVRKDAIVMLDHLVTASPEFFENKSDIDIQEFFIGAYNAIQEKFGHIISAEIHMDERTPHMHVCTVPITEDGRLSAKELLGNKKDMSILQDEMHEKLFAKWGLDRGVKYTEHLNGSKIPKHKVTAKFKEETQSELVRLQGELAKSETNLKRTSTRLENLKKSCQEENGRLTEIKAEFEGIRALKGVLENAEEVEITEKSAFGKVMIDKNDYEKLVHTASYIDEINEYVQQLGQQSLNIEKQVAKYQKELDKRAEEIEATRQKVMADTMQEVRRIMSEHEEIEKKTKELKKEQARTEKELGILENKLQDYKQEERNFKAENPAYDSLTLVRNAGKTIEKAQIPYEQKKELHQKLFKEVTDVSLTIAGHAVDLENECKKMAEMRKAQRHDMEWER